MDGIEIAGRKWNVFVARNMSFWHQCLSLEGHYHNSRDFFNDVNFHSLSITDSGTMSYTLTGANYDLFLRQAVNMAKDGSLMLKLKKAYIEFGKELLDSLDKAIACMKPAEVKEFHQKYRKYCGGLSLTTVLGRGGTQELINKLEKLGYDDEEIPNIVSIVTYPKEHTPLFMSRLDLYLIAERLHSGKTNEEEELSGWLEKYGNIPVNFCDDPWTMQDALSQLTDVMKKDCSNEIRLLKKNHDDKTLESEELLKRIGNDDVTTISHSLQLVSWLNEYRKNIFSRVSLKEREIFKAIAEKMSFNSWRDCFYLFPEEIIGILEGKLPPRDIISQRETIGFYVVDGNKVMLTEDEAEKVLGFVRSTHSAFGPADGQVTGLSANKGIMRGIAKIILNSKDFHKMNQGDIIVTHMTSVDFVPMMEKAAAFVTDEGGITSHAAIVSREMNKPCIIGTGNATRTFKDGDLIEVDANKGVAKIIKRIKNS
jgi:phosphohistidine swiveling domain-containing protein